NQVHFLGLAGKENRVEPGDIDFGLLGTFLLNRGWGRLYLAVALEVGLLDAFDGKAEIVIVGPVRVGGDDLSAEAADFFCEGLRHLRAVLVPRVEDAEAFPAQRAGRIGGKLAPERAGVDGGGAVRRCRTGSTRPRAAAGRRCGTPCS